MAGCCRRRCWLPVARPAWHANVAVVQATVVGRLIAARPSFALIGSCEMLIDLGKP